MWPMTMRGFATGHPAWSLASVPELPGNPEMLSSKIEITSSQERLCSEVTTSEPQPHRVFNPPSSLAAASRVPYPPRAPYCQGAEAKRQAHQPPASSRTPGPWKSLTQSGTEDGRCPLYFLHLLKPGPSLSPEGDEACEEQWEGQHAQDDLPQAVVHTELAPPYLGQESLQTVWSQGRGHPAV